MGDEVFESEEFVDEPEGEDQGFLEDGSPVVEDPDALAAAEAAAMRAPDEFAQSATGEWVAIVRDIAFVADLSGAQALPYVAPLEAEGVPYVWDPYPPYESNAYVRVASAPRSFSILVPAGMEERATDALRKPPVELAAESRLLPPDEEEEVEAASTSAGEVRDRTSAATPEPFAPAKPAPHARTERPAATMRYDDTPTGWAVLLDEVPYDKTRLMTIDHALRAAGIARSWHPSPPEQAVLMNLRVIGKDRFTLRVLESDLRAARQVLAETR